jgi:RNA polymerase sigma-70 factor (ECF subfamily)
VKQGGIAWADLMRAASAGDAAAYELVLRHIAGALRPVIRRGLARAGRSGADTEDVVQEILLAVHLKRHTWDCSRPIEPWIGAIARHKLIDALRRRGGAFDLPIADFSDTLAADESNAPASSHEIERCLSQLPAGQRAVVQAVAVESASIAETADRMKMTPGAVRVALHRGLAALAKTMGS